MNNLYYFEVKNLFLVLILIRSSSTEHVPSKKTGNNLLNNKVKSYVYDDFTF